jgi:phosphate transport system substrate-binding protein
MMKRSAVAGAAFLAAAAVAGGAQAQATRDYISVVGSSTVYPFAVAVAGQFGKQTRFKTPKIESIGSGAGFKLFCGGSGAQHPDIANASRAIKPSELDQCASNGVADVVEIKIGYDGITVAHSAAAKPMALTRRELWLALAGEVPDPKGAQRLVANPYKSWKDINPRLPDLKIEVLGPPRSSGTRDAFVELVMDQGCNQLPLVRALKVSDAKQHRIVCQTLRNDGGYLEAGENDNLIVQKLIANPNTVGIFGYSFLDQNRAKIQGVEIEGVMPVFEAIASGKYAMSRPLYLYLRKAHLGFVPGLNEYIAEFTSPQAWGPDGYLVKRGLVPMPDAERKRYAQVASSLTQASTAK